MFGSFGGLIIVGVVMFAKFILFKTAEPASWKKMPASSSLFRVYESTSNRSHSKKEDQKCQACLPGFFVFYGLLLSFINCFYN